MKHCYLCNCAQDVHTHHIDWNHANNATENTIPLCKRCHTILHQTGYLTRGELQSLRHTVKQHDPGRFVAPPTDLFKGT